MRLITDSIERSQAVPQLEVNRLWQHTATGANSSIHLDFPRRRCGTKPPHASPMAARPAWSVRTEGSRSGQHMPAAGSATTVRQRHVGEIDEGAVADGPASLCHLDRGFGDRPRGHAETAAGDRQRPAAIDATGVDELLERRDKRNFQVTALLRPRLLGRAPSGEAMEPNVEDLRGRGTEARIEDEVEVRTGRRAPSREIVDADDRQAGLVRRALDAIGEPAFDDRGAEATRLRPRRRVASLFAANPVGLGQQLEARLPTSDFSAS